jgi:uncharacterized repeat protein (TIGR04052 family)
MRRVSWVMAAGLAVAGCGGDEDEGGAEAPQTRAVTLRFAAQVGDQPVACGTRYAGVGSTAAEMQLQDFRFYVSEVALLNAAGEVVPLALDEAAPWQGGGVALLDFEDATGACATNGTSETRSEITGTVPAGDYTGLRFTLGVPAALNHQDAATAAAPLNVGAMFWVWQTGYKFLRVDMITDLEAPNDKWFVHLGSTACAADAPTSPPDGLCGKPNRPTYTFTDFEPDADTVVVDLAGLLGGVDITSNTADTPFGCMSNPADGAECTPLFRNLGMDFATGGASDCGFDGCQALFHVQ